MEKDYVSSYAWMLLAKLGNDELARTNIEILRKEMSEEQIAQAQTIASELIKKIEGQ